MTPREFNSEEKFIDWNEEMAHRYDPEAYHERSFFIIRWVERIRVKTILNLLQPSSENFVLEIGCGAGNILEQIHARHLAGLDISVFLINKAKVRLRNSAYLYRANAEKTPFAPKSFDRLICSEVLEHLQNPSIALEEMSRIAKDDAIIVVSIPNEEIIEKIKSFVKTIGLNSLLESGKEGYQVPEKMTDEWHLHSFSLELFNQFIPAGLKIQEVKSVPFSFLPMRYVISLRKI